MVWLIILGIVAIVVLWGIATYNGLVKSRGWIKEAWAQVDVQLKRRNDLIPNVVSTVKGYAKHEQETLEKVIAARNQLVNMQGATPQEIMETSNQITGALKSIFALSESYPELKANQNFLSLQEELTNTENKIAYSRQLYNSSVVNYNIKVQSIPTNIIASIGGFKEESVLETPQEERNVPKVSFD
ncbi:LemA family protein [Granulicatella sp. zg-ZJ]|uniref:LemA family protein n=1 Tax=unclassified Granulicatella TaxID=2630493 RepID=UPI0013BFC157|nr:MULTISPECIES: LemA family protein [unclassified Granulicatella]MBS4750500.1 LemA family protein [Carnobacteriaceae bacterium zg-ZUI78]NEW62557.1 LemA family protein [Granulicatella sp. zg-ZJ]NEW66105.1 LemA family protein [Granulicatella sp. zg-84]QMI85454.1 LemA family protein [Carnobacteriaceae bacterium zg-84]